MFTSYYSDNRSSQTRNNGPLEAVLGALGKAQRTGEPTLLRLYIEAPIADPWGGLDGSEMEPYFAWHDPKDGLTFVGYGAVRTLVGHGPNRFQKIQADYSQCLEQVHTVSIGGANGSPDGLPVAMGGFSFFSGGGDSKQWSGWPEALWILPRVTLVTWKRRKLPVSGAIIQQVVHPSSSPQALVSEIVQSVSNISQEGDVSQTVSHSEPLQRSKNADACPASWELLVQDALDRIGSTALDKVVVARSEDISGGPVDPKGTLHRLRALHRNSRCFAFSPGNGTVFLGASPELLAQSDRGSVVTHALAGTARVGPETGVGQRLFGSKKERYEQAVVVGAIRDSLTPLCTSLSVDETPTVAGFGDIQHLCSQLRGTLQRGTGLLEVARALHPTPAVGGHPKQSALDWLSTHEQLDRGWYAGPIGWLDGSDGGTLAVAIRSALVGPTQTRCFAGAGLVPGSTPKNEWGETCLKLGTVRSGLAGGDP